MAPQTQTKPIQLKANEAVVLEPGLILQPGSTYAGTVTYVGAPVGEQFAWIQPDYKIQLAGEQLAALGQKAPGVESVEFNVTALVSNHRLTPIED
jgi:hypothetical protein